MADLELCRVWRASFWALHTQTSMAGLLRLVVLRQRCLDELERRDSAAVRAWLDHGAQAAGGPERYLRHPPDGHADAA
ncbi:MAG: hypothetical protein HOQ45_23215 [Nocardioidaceae bacterium]|nr:hypothetical protein [Nocardioidaceae bacterium]